MNNIDWQNILSYFKAISLKIWNILLPVIKNIYVIIFLIFFFTFIFGDKYTIQNYIQTLDRLEELEEEKTKLLKKMHQDSTLIRKLQNDEMLEKFAREKYFMKRNNEVLFIIKDKDNEQ